MATMQAMLRCAFRSYLPRFRASVALKSTKLRFLSSGESIPELAFVTSEYKDIYKRSIEDPVNFWGELAASRLQWIKPFTQVMDCDMSVGRHRWFIDGKLNVSENCLDRHVKKNPDHVALIWEKDEPGQHEMVTYRELLEMTSQLANTLKSHGVKKGDNVCIYLPNSPLAVATLLACARIGAPHSVVFAGFSAEALASRITNAGAETVITADQGVRGGKIIELKKTVDEAVGNCSNVRQVFVMSRTGADVPMGKKDIPLEKVSSGITMHG